MVVWVPRPMSSLASRCARESDGTLGRLLHFGGGIGAADEVGQADADDIAELGDRDDDRQTPAG